MSASKTHSKVDAPTFVMSGPDVPDRLMVQKCKLLAVSGPLQGEEFIVDEDEFTIGSDPHNNLVLEDTTISRCHCKIQILPDGYVIRDLGSTNGTLIQGVRVTEAFLEQGTEFQLGKTRIVFCPLQEAMEYTLSSNDCFGKVLGRSVAMRRVFHLAEMYAPTDATILIEGETGTGKEVLAEEIHKHSPRKDKPFMVIDCAALAKDLIESELFGHTKGSFTGATAERVGVFEHADGGTVFLDEIGDLSGDLQPKLLRVLEKKEIRRVGSNKIRQIDVRVISATNRKLENEVNCSRFREDLYFRLSVVHLALAPLRKRKDDILPLMEKFLREFHGAESLAELGDLNSVAESLSNHDWPGNVRELRNLVEIASYSKQTPLDLRDFLYLGRMRTRDQNRETKYTADRPFKMAKKTLVDEFERSYIQDLLLRHGGNISQAARVAQIERAYLQRLIRKHELKSQ